MASPKSKRIVVYAAVALDKLAEIWRWNAEHYHPQHADAYVGFLKKNIDSLATRFGTGRSVTDRPELRYVIIRRKAKGHGHVAVYQIDNHSVNVLHVFHTAEDWQTKLGSSTTPQ